MSSPVVEATNTSVETGTTTTSHAVALPTGIVSGQLLIVLFGYSNTGNTITWPDGWTAVPNSAVEFTTGAQAGIVCGYRWADGGEGSSITVTTSVGMRSAHNSYRLSGAENPSTQAPEAATNSGANLSPDPPSVTPTGGSKDYLWLGVGSSSHGGTYTAFSSGYSGGIQVETGGTTSTHSITGSCYLQSTASSADPGAFTHDQSGAAEMVAVTIAVHPASAAPADPAFLPELVEAWAEFDDTLHDWVFWLTPADVVVVEDMPALGLLEEQIADDVEAHEFTFWLVPDDVVDFQPLPEWGEITADRENEADEEGWLWAAIEDVVVVEDFQALPVLVESVAIYDDTLYQWAGWPLPAELPVEDFQALPELVESEIIFDDTLFNWTAGPNSLSGLPGFTIGLVRITSTVKGLVVTLGLKAAKASSTYKGVRDGTTD